MHPPHTVGDCLGTLPENMRDPQTVDAYTEIGIGAFDFKIFIFRVDDP